MLENADLPWTPSTSLSHSQNTKDFHPWRYEEVTKWLQIYFVVNLLNVSSHKDYTNKAGKRAFVLWEKRLFGFPYNCRNGVVKRYLLLFWCPYSLSMPPLDELLSVLEHFKFTHTVTAASGLNHSFDKVSSFTVRTCQVQLARMCYKFEIHRISDKMF